MNFERLIALKELLVPKYAMRIEPQDPINTENDFTRELIKYCNDEGKELVILKEGMLPVVKIDGKTYIARLDRNFGLMRYGAKVDTPNKLPYFGSGMGNFWGYKWIYLYPYQYN